VPRRSTVDLLPQAVRTWLDKALVEGAFGGYEALSAEMASRGYTISRSALQRYGSKFEDQLAKIKLAAHQATAIAEALPDDAGQLGDAVTRIVQQKAMDLLMDMELEADKESFTDVGTMLAKLNAAGVQQKKWASEVKQRAKATAEEVATVAKAAGLTPQAVSEIRSKILGIAK
jgi:hypothetical protein